MLLSGCLLWLVLAFLGFCCRELLLRYRVDVTRIQVCLQDGLAWDELARSGALLDSLDALEGLVQVVIDEQTHGQDGIVIDLFDHTDQLGLQLRQGIAQIFKGVALLGWLSLVNDLIGKVDIALDKIHIIDELVILGRYAISIVRAAF